MRCSLTLVFLRGFLPPPNGLLPIAPKRKTKWPGHLSNLFYILCGYFYEKQIREYPLTRGCGKPSQSEGTISSLYMPKQGEIFGTFYFWSIFCLKSTFLGRPCLIRSLWGHTLTDFHDFGINGKKRPYPILYYQTLTLWAC